MEALPHLQLLHFRIPQTKTYPEIPIQSHFCAAEKRHFRAPVFQFERPPLFNQKFGPIWKVCMASKEAVEAERLPQDSTSEPKTLGKAVVIGAGPAGCVMALNLLHKGFQVHIFERRSMLDEAKLQGDLRSYPILLTSRGIKAIKAVGLELPSSILKPQVGNCTHLPNGKKRKMDYYSGPGIQSFVASRNGLVSFLQQSLLQRASGNLSCYFGWEIASIDDIKSTATFHRNPKYSTDAESNVLWEGKNNTHEIEIEFDLMIGADGVSSKVRSEVLRLGQSYSSTSDKSKKAHITVDFTNNPRVYKSFYVRPSLAKESTFIVDHDRVQSWRTLNMMLINVADGSFWGGTLNEELVNALSPTDVERIFREKAPDVLDLLLRENPNFAEEFWRQPSKAGGGAVILSQFHHRNIVMIGDAAHAMVNQGITSQINSVNDVYKHNVHP